MNDHDSKSTDGGNHLLKMAGQIVSAYVSNNSLSSSELTDVIRAVHDTLSDLENGVERNNQNLTPVVPIKKSITADYIICLEDGKKLKMLKRYLRSQYGMTPEEYRARWNLPPDYPMVAPNYATQRSKLAKQIGLGKVAGNPSPRGRRKK